ncbi:MAG: GDSL-type esterase/lipase family protein [Dysgonamonadaceae bacterium]|jgi:lysophospholipase L1-like esterase|nr:GDSL-type esterase/lipase family protein [Dysgonamonadaceae bacterium]
MKKRLILLFLFGITAHLYGKEEKINLPKIDLPEYTFIDYSSNVIQIPGEDSSQIKAFYQKIDKLLKEEEGQINILHIGGSHVQADMFSHQVRSDLDVINSRYQTPRGFIFPYSVAKTNNPLNYKVHYTGKWAAAKNIQPKRNVSVGVAGIAVYTDDPEASVSVVLNPDDVSGRWNFDRLRLLGYVEDSSEKVKPVLHHNDVRFEACYDSINSTYFFELPEAIDSFRVDIIQEDTLPHTFILTGFIPEKDTPGIVYHSIGVNGASVPSYLDSEFFEDELRLIKPDLVIFGIGINDASGRNFTARSFIENYNLLIRKVKQVQSDCAFIFITNNDSFKRIRRRKYAVNLNGLVVKDAFFKIAEENQGGVWDLFSIMGGVKSMQTWQSKGLAKSDKVHFTKPGYELLGDLLYNALIDFYLQNDLE